MLTESRLVGLLCGSFGLSRGPAWQRYKPNVVHLLTDPFEPQTVTLQVTELGNQHLTARKTGTYLKQLSFLHSWATSSIAMQQMLFKIDDTAPMLFGGKSAKDLYVGLQDRASGKWSLSQHTVLPTDVAPRASIPVTHVSRVCGVFLTRQPTLYFKDR
jgi:hypothetical protein